MSVSANTPAIKLKQRIGAMLRDLREAAGYRTQKQVAEVFGYTQQHISQIERGSKLPPEEQIGRMLDTYRATQEQRGAILALMAAGAELRQQWQDGPKFDSVFTPVGRHLIALESGAAMLYVFSGTYVPGLLQQEDYITALVAFDLKDESLRRRELSVEGRLNRQEIVYRDDPVELHAIVLESALRAVVGGPSVMKRQLQALLAMAKKEHITVRVIPFSAGAAAAYSTPFSILNFADQEDKPVVHHEKPLGDELSDDEETVRVARRKFEDLEENSLSPEDTVPLIEKILEEL